MSLDSELLEKDVMNKWFCLWEEQFVEGVPHFSLDSAEVPCTPDPFKVKAGDIGCEPVSQNGFFFLEKRSSFLPVHLWA